MNKKTITFGAVLSVLLIFLFSSFSHAVPISEVAKYWRIIKNPRGSTVELACTASAAACPAVKLAINPDGAIQEMGLGELGKACPGCGQAISAATNPQGFVTQTALAEANKELPGFSEALTLSQEFQDAGVQNAELKVNTKGKVTEVAQTEITKPMDITKIADIEEGSINVEKVEIRKSEEKDHVDVELKAESSITVKDAEGNPTNLIKGIKGDAKIDKDGLKELKGEIEEDTDFNVKLGDQAFKVTVKSGNKVDYNREEGFIKIDGKDPFKWQQLNEERKPSKDPIKFTPQAREDGIYEKTEIKVNPDTGNAQVKGKMEIEVEGHKIGLGGWGFRERGEVEIVELGGEVRSFKALNRYTEFNDGGHLIGGKKGFGYFPRGLTAEEKGGLRGGYVSKEGDDEFKTEGDARGFFNFGKGTDDEFNLYVDQEGGIGAKIQGTEGKSNIHIGRQDPFVTEIGKYNSKTGEGTVDWWARKKFEAEQGREPTEAELNRYTQKILDANGLDWDKAKKLKSYDTISVPSYSAGSATIVTPQRVVKIDGATQGLFTNPTWSRGESVRKTEGEKLGIELPREDWDVYEDWEGYEEDWDAYDEFEEPKVVETLTYEDPWMRKYELKTDDQGNSQCCRGAFVGGGSGGKGATRTFAVGVDSVTGAAPGTKPCMGDLVYYRNFNELYGSPWILDKEKIEDYVFNTDYGNQEYLYESGKYLNENKVKVSGVGRITHSKLTPPDELGKSYFRFTNEKGKTFEIEYREGEAGAVISEIDSETGEHKEVIGFDDSITSVLAGVENDVVDGVIERHLQTGTIRGIHARLQAMEEQKLTRGSVTTVSY